MKLAFVTGGQPPIPMYDRRGGLIGMQMDRRIIGFTDCSQHELEALGEGSVLRVSRVHEDELEFELIQEGHSPASTSRPAPKGSS